MDFLVPGEIDNYHHSMPNPPFTFARVNIVFKAYRAYLGIPLSGES